MGHDAWRRTAALLCLACLCRAQAGGTEPALTPIAHSALVTVDATYTAQGLKLRIERATDRDALPVSSLEVSIDGRSAHATALADGAWLVPSGAGGDRGRRVELVVGHDGIRELLSGVLPSAGAARSSAPAGTDAATGGLARVLHEHKQLAWWVLNITVLLIAAIALSRRFS